MSRFGAILALDPEDTPPPRGFMNSQDGIDRERYRLHKNNAARRGIQFLFTFEEWLAWWEATGHYDQRGRNSGKYVMARKGDKGAYEPGNVECKRTEENIAEAHLGKKRSPESRQRQRDGIRLARARRSAT